MSIGLKGRMAANRGSAFNRIEFSAETEPSSMFDIATQERAIKSWAIVKQMI